MSKPKNMTPEQEAAWKERERVRRATPEYKAAAKARSRAWYEREGNKEKLLGKIAEKRRDAAFVEIERAAERKRIATNSKRKEKDQQRHKDWRATAVGAKQNRATSRRYYDRNGETIKAKRRDSRAFDHFMKRLEEEASSC